MLQWLRFLYYRISIGILWHLDTREVEERSAILEEANGCDTPFLEVESQCS